MWKMLKYLFYKLYKLFMRMHGENDIPEYTAMFGVGTLLLCNLIASVSIIDVFFPFWDFPEISRGKFFIIVGIPYVLILYFSFIYKGKYLRIKREYETESEEQRKKGSRNIKIYMVLSLFLIVLSLLLMVLKNEGLILG